MKLPTHLVHRITPDQASPPVDLPADHYLNAALALAGDGWAVFPLRPGSKVPLLPRAHERGGPRCNGECGRDGHGAHDGTTDPETIRRWWTKNPAAGIGANLGEDRLAIDLDFQHGAVVTDDQFPDTRTHWSGRANGNRHLIYRIEPGTRASTIKSGTDVISKGIDIRSGRGSYVVMPPTLHEETHKSYRVGDEHGGLEHVLTDAECEAIFGAVDGPGSARKTARARGAAKGLSVVPRGSGNTRGTLSGLLADPPAEGGRNDWLTRVAGHYAKQYRDKQDLFEVHVRQANGSMPQPLDEAEVDKILDSIWHTEEEQHPERAASIGNGWLVGNGRHLLCQVQRKEGEETVYDLAPFGDFDLIARGVAIDEIDRRMYWVRLNWHGRQIDTTLDSEVLGDDRALRKWLAARGASVDPPFNAIPKTATGVRLLRYLNSQNPEQVHIVDTLGWHSEINDGAGGFVTHDGVITGEGVRAKEDAGVVADPHLVERDVAPFVYGFTGDLDQATAVLREVLTFQDPETASVFGGWWAACLLRPQIQARSSLFPFFGVEAPSESGKTNGFFDLMVQLNGNTRGQIVPTRPVLRDYASANRNGIVWADDLDSLEAYGELLRASTSNGTAAKMDIDRNGVKNTQVVAPILITGEALGMADQKALLDRSVVLEVASPKDRQSLHGEWLQWDDILELNAKYPKEAGGLSSMAGHLVRAALGYEHETIRMLKKAKTKGSGRHGDKMAVLLAGAALLDALVGHENSWEGRGEHYRAVLAWTHRQGMDRLDKDNAATLKIIPWALRTWGFPQDFPEPAPDMGRWVGIDTPVFFRKSKRVAGMDEADTLADSGTGGGLEVWVSVSLLAAAWARDHNHRVDERTETAGALRQQIDALRASSLPFTLSGTRRKARYRLLPPEYSRVVLQRARD